MVRAATCIALFACGGAQERPPIEVPTVERGCLEAAGLHEPPAPPAIEFACPPGGCTEEITVCTDFAGGLALEQWTRRIIQWSKAAWIACRPTPDSPPDGEKEGQ